MSTQDREQMITQNIPLVVHIAKGYCGKGVDFDDLVSEGSLGLMQAVDRFDPSLGKFSTYAVFWIRQKLNRALSNHSRTIRLPCYVVTALNKAGWQPEGNKTLEHAASVRCESLDSEEAREVAAPNKDDKPEQTVLAALQDALFTLPKRDRYIISQRFFQDKTLEEVGTQLGLTRERVRQLQNRALKRLRIEMEPFKE